MATREVQNLRLRLAMKIARLNNMEGFLDTDMLSILNADLTAENSSAESSNPNMLRESLQRLRQLDKRIDECEEMFHIYHIPRVTNFSSTQACESAVHQFMSIWREKCKRGREEGLHTLTEWLRKSNLPGKDSARQSAIWLGTRISFCIASYFALIALSSLDKEEFDRRVRNVAAAIGCLRVAERREEGRVIDAFLLVVSITKSALMSGTVGEIFRGWVSVTPAVGANDMMDLILKDVLMLEAAYNCPALPMKLTAEEFSGMMVSLHTVVDKMLARVLVAMEKLEEELGIGITYNHRHKLLGLEKLYYEVARVWEKLVLM